MTKLYEIRNQRGQFIGAYYAKSEKLAIKRAESELNAGANAFRKSWSRVSLADCKATAISVEGR